MVQKEAAQRICAPVGSRESGAVTVSVNYYAEPSLQFHVSAGSFMPAPKVDSAVIRLDVRKEPPVITDEEKFFRVVKAAFSQRRKVISNSLSSGLKMSKDEINEVLAAANVPSNARAEKLSLDDFAAIAGNLRD
jgi:16S rRNA (adenine1518-N6/adenine1519-N6)-dimethyltransferase